MDRSKVKSHELFNNTSFVLFTSIFSVESTVKLGKSKALQCSICLDRFKTPKMLPCLHRFCKECLISWVPRGTRVTSCPQCRQKTIVPDGDAAKFPTDFHLKELVEEDAIREKATAGGDFTCTCCDNQSPVVAKCVKCRNYLCGNGLAKHRQSANLRTHKVVIFEVNTEEVNCVTTNLVYTSFGLYQLCCCCCCCYCCCYFCWIVSFLFYYFSNVLFCYSPYVKHSFSLS